MEQPEVPELEVTTDKIASVDVNADTKVDFEVVESPEDVLICRRVREWCHPHSVSMALKYLCEHAPEVFPRHTAWRNDKLIKDVPTLIYDKLMSDGYVESILPALKLMLTTSILNISWTARVAVGIATYDVVKDLAGV